MVSQLSSAQPLLTYRGSTHNQPDPTGSLLRIDAVASSPFVSNVPVPNNVQVEVLSSCNDFTYISYNGQEGWVRTKYLTTTHDDATSFELTTYNILTGGLPWEGISPYEAETTGMPNALWDNRKDLIVDALKDKEIVMLNEATD